LQPAGPRGRERGCAVGGLDDAYRRAADTGDRLGTTNLGTLLQKQGRADEADGSPPPTGDE
jgi:hypothetical protein